MQATINGDVQSRAIVIRLILFYSYKRTPIVYFLHVRYTSDMKGSDGFWEILYRIFVLSTVTMGPKEQMYTKM